MLAYGLGCYNNTSNTARLITNMEQMLSNELPTNLVYGRYGFLVRIVVDLLVFLVADVVVVVGAFVLVLVGRIGISGRRCATP